MQLGAEGRQWLPPSIHSVTTQFNSESQQQVGDSCPVSELHHTSLVLQARIGRRIGGSVLTVRIHNKA